MRSNEEFKSEVYSRAEEKQKQIRLRRRRLAVMIPCIAIVILAVTVSFGFMDLPTLQTEDSAPSQTEKNSDVNNMAIQNNIEADTAVDVTVPQTAGNSAQIPNNDTDGAQASDNSSYETLLSGTPPVSSSNYLCIRMFFVEPKMQEPYVFAQVIDSPSELETYFKENNCDGEESFYSFYTDEAFEGVFFIALNGKGYDFKGITQTDEAIEIRMQLNENGDSSEKAALMMLPLFEKQYDKTKRIDIIK